MYGIYCIALLSFLVYLGLIKADNCTENDYRYILTPCDRHGERWKVPVPKNKNLNCTSGVALFPLKAKSCITTCPDGHYIDAETGSCQKCNPGSYSMFGGALFDTWNSIPSSFYIETIPGENCTISVWTPKGQFISSEGSSCASILTYSETFIDTGHVQFDYQHSDPNVDFFFDVQNDLCKLSSNNGESSMGLRHSEQGTWVHKKIRVNKGRNVFSWTTYIKEGNRATASRSTRSPVLLRDIKVSGIASTTECSLCKAGTYSDQPGSSDCMPCPHNHFSKPGSPNCTACKESEYASEGSPSCIQKKPCKNTDIHTHYESCNGDNKTRIVTEWIQPLQCLESDSQSVKLSPPKEFISCVSCNPGTRILNASSCSACPSGQTTLPSRPDVCVSCNNDAQPVYGMHYTRWSRWPPNVEIACHRLSIESRNCSNVGEWQLMQDHILAGKGADADVLALMKIPVDSGFLVDEDDMSSSRKRRDARSESQTDSQNLGIESRSVVIDFEIRCKGACSLYFMTQHDQQHEMIGLWNTEMNRTTFIYRPRTASPATFIWAFNKMMTKDEWKDEYRDDHVKIYAINITGMAGGIVNRCQFCGLGKTNKGCIPCPLGKFYNDATKTCDSCQLGQVVMRWDLLNEWSGISGSRIGHHCMSCGENMVAFRGQYCHSPSHIHRLTGLNGETLKTRSSSDTLKYQLDNLMNRSLTVTSRELFVPMGARYLYIFNFTLDNRNVSNYPTCISNISSLPNKTIRALVCRSTVTAFMKQDGFPISSNPMSLGDELVAVRHTNSSSQFRNAINSRLRAAGWTEDEDGYDLHYFLNTSDVNLQCPDGINSIITVRCASKQELTHSQSSLSSSLSDSDNRENIMVWNNGVEIPPRCPVGTCDGCTFHLLWRTHTVCPICDVNAYRRVEGECIAGKQVVHLIPPKRCYLGGRDPPQYTEDTSCPLLSRTSKYAIGIALIVGSLLFGTSIYLYKRNRKLEYKYMKLAQARPGGRDGYDDGAELPGAESCAVHEGEEEDEDDELVDYQLQPHLKGAKRFQKKGRSGDHKRKGMMGGGSNSGSMPGVQFLSDAHEGARIQFKSNEGDLGMILDDELARSGPSSNYSRSSGPAISLFSKIKKLNPGSSFKNRREGRDSLEGVNLTEAPDYPI